MKEEYVIYDFVAMVSAVGGTMGLCIGFSFVTVSNCLLNYMQLGIHFLNKLQLKQGPPSDPATQDLIGSRPQKDPSRTLKDHPLATPVSPTIVYGVSLASLASQPNQPAKTTHHPPNQPRSKHNHFLI